MLKRIIKGSVPVALVALTVGVAHADELLRFKTGYEMMVLSHREEKGLIIVTVDGGGEIGFPKELLEIAEGGKASQRTGPSLRNNRTPPRTPYTSAMKLSGSPDEAPTERVFAQGSYSNGRSIHVGFSMAGEKLERFTAGATGAAQKIGTSLVRGGAPSPFSPVGPPPVKKKGPLPIQADIDEGTPP